MTVEGHHAHVRHYAHVHHYAHVRHYAHVHHHSHLISSCDLSFLLLLPLRDVTANGTKAWLITQKIITESNDNGRQMHYAHVISCDLLATLSFARSDREEDKDMAADHAKIDCFATDAGL